MQAGSTQNNKDSAGRRLGIKKFGGHEVFPDDILVRQRGFRFHPGKNTYTGRDHTIHAKAEGIVRFEKDPWRKKKLYYVHVDKQENINRTKRPPPPYSYHPQLFPELAKANPTPFVFTKKAAVPEPEKSREFLGKKVEVPKRVEMGIPESYLSAPRYNTMSASEQIYRRVSELQMKHLGIGIENAEAVPSTEAK